MDLLAVGGDKLSAIERWQIRTIQRTFNNDGLDRVVRFCQRNIGAHWIHWATSNLHHIHHFERVPQLSADDSAILVCNHRSFFDLYLITAELIRRGMTQRIVFPVRSGFFYDSPLGFLVNGAMSFFAMYPPVFREASRAALNAAGLDELVTLVGKRGTFVGIHPEGRRGSDPDARQLLPGQTGVGRLVRRSNAMVIPAFTNGLLPSDILAQIRGNLDGSGTAIHTVFGAPIDFGALREKAPSPRLYREITDVVMAQIAALGEEEAVLRQEHSAEAKARG